MGKHIQGAERLAKELQKYPCLYEKVNKGYKETDWEEDAWRVFSIFMNNIRGPSHILKGRTFFFINFAKTFLQ